MSKVKLIECPRDAWQGLAGQVPTDAKVAYLRALVAAGFKHVDAVSFVSPKAVPQMADFLTLMSTSFGPGSGTGTFSIQSPTSGLALTRARIMLDISGSLLDLSAGR